MAAGTRKSPRNGGEGAAADPAQRPAGDDVGNESHASRSLNVPKLWSIVELLRPFTLLAPLIGGASPALVAFRISGGTGISVVSDPSLPLFPFRIAGIGLA